MKKLGKNQNMSDLGGTPVTVALNSSTTVKILDANPDRVGYELTNNSSHDVWIKRQAASVDNIVTGNAYVFKRSFYESPTDYIYTGEVSAIAVSGSPSVTVSEI